MQILTDIGNRIYSARRQAALTQLGLARKLGQPWTPSAISRAETGQRDLRVTEVAAIAEAIGVDIGLLIGLPGDDAEAAYRLGRDSALRDARTALDFLD